MSKILVIDGLDGSGKHTVSQHTEQHLKELGYSVLVIEPPFYHTRPGQLVTEYLHKGHQDARSRWIAAQIYSNDRNIWMMKNFHRFNDFQYDVILYNRSWLASLLFHSSLICATPEETARTSYLYNISMLHLFRDSLLSATLVEMYAAIQKISMEYGRVSLLTPELEKLLFGEVDLPFYANPRQRFNLTASELNPHQRRDLMWIFKVLRANEVLQLMLKLWFAEVDPWRAEGFLSASFAETYGVRSVVMMPSASLDAMQVISDNMKERYAGDAEKLDHHEASQIYQVAVAENANFIANNFAAIVKTCTNPTTRVRKSIERIVRDNPGVWFPIADPKMLDIFWNHCWDAFRFTIVQTTTGSGPAIRQRDINDVAETARCALGINTWKRKE